ncbi:MAG: hypothetical protein IJQ95_02335 [Paludibacteraceae bacterium]|nr:hypothetical protein [Paludibacteraceae bacterium]
MRIDIAKNMRAILRQEKRRATRRWVIFCGIIFGIGYLFILISTYVLKPNGTDASDQAAVNGFENSVVRVDAFVAPGPSKHSTGRTIASYYHADYTPGGLIRHDVPTVNPVSHSANGSTTSSPAIKVHTTSSAKVHNVGAGVTTGGAAAVNSTSQVSSSVPFSSSTSNMVVSTAVWTSSRALSAQNTLETEQRLIAANSVDATATAAGPRRVGGKPLDPFMDPIGDGLYTLLLAALVYAGSVIIRRKKQMA